MTDQNQATTSPAKTGISIPVTTIVIGVIGAIVVGVTYVFFGPDAAKAVCTAVL